MTSAERIADLARAGGRTVGVAESLTSGRICAELGKAARASEWFAGGVVAYRTEVKERVLGTRPGLDPCSAECAEQLARGARELLGSDVAVAVTGVGGPEPEGGHQPGTVYLGWADERGTGSRLLRIAGDPAGVVADATDAVLRLLHALLDERSAVPAAADTTSLSA